MDACRECHGRAGPGELQACSRCTSKYHQECHQPYIKNIYLADPDLSWYCFRCTKEGWSSDQPPPAIQRSPSYEEAGKRQRKRPRIEDVDDKIDKTAEEISDTADAYGEKQRHKQGQDVQDIDVKGHEQQTFDFEKEWQTTFRVVNKRLKAINRQFAINMEELARRQRDMGDMTDATQRIMALEQDVKDRDDKILALEQAPRDQLRIVELERQNKELKAKLTKAKELSEEAAKAEQERIRAQQERAMRAQNVFAFDESLSSSST